VFFNSMYLSNYEFDRKGDVPDDEEDKKDDKEEEVDERTKRKKKGLDSFEIVHEDGIEGQDSFKFQKACAEATGFSRDLVNTRGSEATPEWMEMRTRELLEKKSCDAVKEVKVL